MPLAILSANRLASILSVTGEARGPRAAFQQEGQKKRTTLRKFYAVISVAISERHGN